MKRYWWILLDGRWQIAWASLANRARERGFLTEYAPGAADPTTGWIVRAD